MGDPRVSPTTFKDSVLPKATVDDQISGVLNDPKKGENAKVADLKKIFDGLSDTDKMALYDRLKDRKNPGRDPLVKDFHYRLSHGQNGTVEKALKMLNPNHGAPGLLDTIAKAAGEAANNAGKTKALDNKTFEEIFKKGLAKEEPKTDFGPEILQWTKDIVKTPGEKAEIIAKRLERASKEDLQKIMKESENWPKESREIVNEAMRKSPAVMARIAKEFSVDQQLKVLERTLEKPNNLLNTKSAESKALKAWMDNVSADDLNGIMWKIGGQTEALLKMKISQQINSSDFSTFNKLAPNFKMGLLVAEHSNPDKNPKALADAFGQLEPAEKNQVFDYMQKINPNALPDFMKDVAQHLGNPMLRGLNKENAEFLQETFKFLAKNAKSDDLKELYANSARFLKGWMEEVFKASK